MNKRYEIIESGRTLVLYRDGSGGSASEREEIRYPFPIVEAIEIDDDLFFRLDVPAGEIFNENVFRNSFPSKRIHPVPKRPHPTPYSPYIKLERRAHMAILYNLDGGVMELAGLDVVQEYTLPPGPKYWVDGRDITFPNGKKVTMLYDILQVFQTGTVVIIRTQPPNWGCEQGVVAYDEQGALRWQLPPGRMYDNEYLPFTMDGEWVLMFNRNMWKYHVNAETGEIVKKEFCPWG